jgi:hypothetical protein
LGWILHPGQAQDSITEQQFEPITQQKEYIHKGRDSRL